MFVAGPGIGVRSLICYAHKCLLPELACFCIVKAKTWLRLFDSVTSKVVCLLPRNTRKAET